MKQFRLSKKNKIIAGVCGGISEYLNIDVFLIRLIYLLLFWFYGIGALPYIIIWGLCYIHENADKEENK